MSASDLSQYATPEERTHPTPAFYVRVAGALAIMTALEFATYFIDFGAVALPMLLILMAIKFAMVVGFFMHAKFDHTVYARLLLLGLGGALVLFGAVVLAVFELPASLPI